jgi:hypothetical protein
MDALDGEVEEGTGTAAARTAGADAAGATLCGRGSGGGRAGPGADAEAGAPKRIVDRIRSNTGSIFAASAAGAVVVTLIMRDPCGIMASR